jgi:hypothetical protein
MNEAVRKKGKPFWLPRMNNLKLNRLLRSCRRSFSLNGSADKVAPLRP